jgi:hypothetical protein
MGKLKTQNSVYGGELQGIRLGLDLVHDSLFPQSQIAIFADNQGAIYSSSKPRHQNGQHILIDTINTVQALKTQGYDITLYWISAHGGGPGNEQADMEAKWAAEWGDISQAKLLPTVGSIVNFWTNKRLKQEWAARWSYKKTPGRAIHKLQPLPTKEVLYKHDGLPKHLSSLITQMRTDKIGLKAFLYGLKLATSPLCDSYNSGAHQTTKYIILSCPAFSHIRLQWPPDLKEILNHSTMALEAANFMYKTRLLKQFSHRLEPLQAPNTLLAD